jgi:electron transfer flavoprotein alpha subunit
MARVLIVAEHDGRKLNVSTAKCVRCAASLAGAEIRVLVIGASAAIAAEAAALEGVTEVLAVESAALASPVAAAWAPVVVAQAGEATHVFGPSTTFGKDLMPRVAALLGVGQVSDVMAVAGERTFRRPVYAGNAIVTVEVQDGGPVVATVRTASYARSPRRANHPPTRATPASPRRVATGPTCRRPTAWSRAAARWAAPRTSS